MKTIPRTSLAKTIAIGLGVLACVAGGVSACSGAPSNSRVGILAPDETQFAPLEEMLDHRCGSLDCHGSRQRNLVIYGCYGLRLDDAGVPGCRSVGGTNTTDAELDATYRSLVGLEPAVMSNVVAGTGQYPQLLTFVRKARGEEAHKGGALIVPGDVQDQCIAAWLSGVPNPDDYAAACTAALAIPPGPTAP